MIKEDGSKFEMVVAYSIPSRGIGWNGSMPWKLSADLRHFYELTKGGVVIMGRNTWESIPITKRPLKERVNIVLTQNPDRLTETPDYVCKKLSDALDLVGLMKKENPRIFIIGGSKLYEEAILHSDCHRIHVTEIYKDFTCDTFFPFMYMNRFHPILFSPIQQEKNLLYRFITYERSIYY